MCDKEPTNSEICQRHQLLEHDTPDGFNTYESELEDAHRDRGFLLKKLKDAQKLTKQWRKPGASVWNECAKQMDKILDGEMK